MMLCSSIRRICVALAVSAAGVLAAACGKNDEAVATAQNNIFKALQNQGIYERDNLPVDNPPTPEQIKGRYDLVGGAYRWIVNENRADRTTANRQWEIARGDSIAFMFDARIFTGGSFDNQQTFYTNIESRIKELMGNNPDFKYEEWPTKPLRIKVGDDSRILKSLQEALIGGSAQACRAGDGDPSNDEKPDNVMSDQVRVYLTPDIAFGNRTVYNVPRNSTLVFEITDIVIIR